MQANLELYSICGASLLTFFVLLTVDVYPIFVVPFAGAVHWLPELLAIFLLSNYAAKNFNSTVKWSIFCCTISYPILLYKSSFGFVASAVFGSSILAGFLFEDIKKRRVKK